MKKDSLLHNLLTAGIKYETHSGDYRRLIMLSAVLYITVISLTFFAIYNVFVLENYLVAALDFFAALNAFYALYYINKYKRVERAKFLGTLNLFVFLLSFTLVTKNNDFGLLWTIFLPVFSILINGWKKGLMVSACFYVIIFYIAYTGVDVWQDGAWTFMSFLRFVVASSALTYIVYFMEYSQTASDEKLLEVRKHDEKNLQELKKLSIVDPLTKLYNRRHFVDIFEKQYKLANRHKLHFGLFILDIDYFKQYNDTYGHQLGDDVLCKVADLLKQFMRRSDDYIFRVGGEEFSGIYIVDEAESVRTRIPELIQAIEDMKIEHKDSKVSEYLTVSIGAIITQDFETHNYDSLYKEADKALYMAKEEGRNRVVFL